MSILVTRSSMPPFEEYIEEIRDIWESHWLTNMGPKHKQFQAALCDYLNVQHIELLTNGHMALEMVLQAMDLQGEVITTPFTFASTTHAIVRNGLEPVFCDIDPQTFVIDHNKIESLITEKTCAILPVHVYGNICNVEAIEKIAKKYELKVIYDAAHTFGETYKGKCVGAYGDASIYSFHATKVFNSIEGGAVIYKEEALGKTLYELKNFGILDEDHVVGVGANAKMNEFCAAMGICNLRHLKEEISKRKVLAERYITNLKEIDGIQLNHIQEDVEYNYAYFPVVIDEKKYGRTRMEVYEHLKEHNINARKYFYPLTNSFSAFHGKYNPMDTPVALGISKRVLTLPLYADLSIDEVDGICTLIQQFKNTANRN